MKKLLVVLVVGLLLATSTKAAETPKSTTLYKVDDKTITYYVDPVSDENGNTITRFFVNNKPIFEATTVDFAHANFSLYKTNVKNLVAIGYESQEMGADKSLSVIDLNSSKYTLIEEGSSEDNVTRIAINGKAIKDTYSANGCDSRLLNKPMGTGIVKNVHPIIRGFVVDNQTIFKMKNISDLYCDILTGQIGDLHVSVRESSKKFIGITKDLNAVYFSAKGDGWTAYYAYDIKANKIVKTTLANINKNKIKITLLQQTYKNQKYGFSFQFLPDWNIGATSYASSIDMFNKKLPTGGDAQIIMVVRDNAVFNEVVSEFMNQLPSEYCEIKKSNIVVAGVPGVKLERKTKQETCKERGNCKMTCVDYNSDTVVFGKNNNVFVINSSGGSGVNDNFNKVVETFTFTD